MGDTVEKTGNLTMFIVLWSFKNLISVSEFYLVKWYMKHTSGIWNGFFKHFFVSVRYPYFMYLHPNWCYDEPGPICGRFKKFVKAISNKFQLK